MERTRVAWLIPVRDGAEWLGDAVRSALAQSLPHDEVIVVDDGSRDSPGRVLPRDPRVRLLVQPPGGIVAALEHGRHATDAPYLARLDCDDLALPGRLDAQVALLDAEPDVVAVGGRAPTDGLPEGMRHYVAWVNGLEDLHRELLVESPLFHPGTTLRAAALARVGGYRHGPFPEDYDLWLRLARIGRLAAVPLEVVAWRDRPGRLTRTDPRSARKAFLGIKQDYLRDVVLPAHAGLAPARRVVVWGANKEGTPWIRWLRDQGCEVVAALDIHGGGTRHGVPILPREAIRDLAFDRCFVAVGARGARAEIRGMLAAWRPELVEGRDWWALA
jgi:glycosyltransferase involved in cell wall biosynthesis